MAGEPRVDAVALPCEMADHHVQPAVCTLRSHQPQGALPLVRCSVYLKQPLGLISTSMSLSSKLQLHNQIFSFISAPPLRFNSGLLFGIFAMLGSVVLLVKTLQQTLAQMTTNNPRMGAQQTLQVVVCRQRMVSFCTPSIHSSLF